MDPNFLDLETTGFTKWDDFCEVAIVDLMGDSVYESLAKPRKKIPKASIAIHGITNEEVEAERACWEVRKDFYWRLKGKRLGIFNAGFDCRFLPGIKKIAHVFCVQSLSAACLDLPTGRGERTLSRVAEILDIKWPEGHKAHRAFGDAHVTAKVFSVLEKEFPYEVAKASFPESLPSKKESVMIVGEPPTGLQAAKIIAESNLDDVPFG